MLTQNLRLIIILCSVSLLLLIPLIVMQFTPEVYWTVSDFLVMGALLLGSGLGCELVLRTIKNSTNRLVFCGVILFLSFLVWAELAVGIFGTPLAGS